jgi:hypothetical protein
VEAAHHEGQHDHAHRILGVLQAVAERHGGGRDGLGVPEPPAEPPGLPRRKIHKIAIMTKAA